MSKVKQKGTSRLGRDSQSKRLGVKKFGGQVVTTGMILVRQRGSKWYRGKGTIAGGDDTILAGKDGVVKFYQRKVRRFDASRRIKTFVSVE